MNVARMLTPGLASLLADIEVSGRWLTLQEIDKELDGWATQGAEIRQLGVSRGGRAIRAAVIGGGNKTFLAWAHPHPDEPIGGLSLVELGRAAIAGTLPDLDDWRLVLILCADPDNAARQLWLHGAGEMADFASGAWRPAHLGLEVDYGFPIDWGPFYQPSNYEGRCRTNEECAINCGTTSISECKRRAANMPFGPLPESKALLKALEIYQPQLVAAMHNTHTAGDYTFLLRREHEGVLDDLVALPGLLGSARHLGEPVDRGVRWRRNDPDLIRERTAEFHQRRLERHPNYQEGYAYAGNASAAVIVETMLPGAQFVCPESAVFRHPDFANTDISETELEYKVSFERRRRGAYEVHRIRIADDWVVAQQIAIDELPVSSNGASIQVAPATRSALGVAAVWRRRAALDAADRVWREVSGLPDLEPHPYLEERALTTVPGRYVADRSLLIFRTRPDYRRVATVAQAATLNWVWPAHTISLLANFRNFLASQDQSRPEIRRATKQVREIQAKEIEQLPQELRRQADQAVSVRSQLSRVMRLMLSPRE